MIIHDLQGGVIFFFSRTVNNLLVRGRMLPKLDKIYNFSTMKFKVKYHYLVISGVTPFQNLFQPPGGQKCQTSLGLL